MKISIHSKLFYVFAVMAAIVCGSILAAGQAFAPTKIATIETDAFSDPKSGITRLVTAMSTVDRDMKPRRDEIAGLRAQYDALVKEINETRSIADQKTIAAKADQAENISRDVKRKQEDGQALLNRRLKALTDPIYTDVMRSLDAYVKKRGIDLVIDLSKNAGSVMVVNQAVDITAAFVAEYNARPATP